MALAYAVVCAPVLGEFIRVWSNFYPTGDDAVEAIAAHNVFSVHTPLVGMYSGISDPGKPFVYHLGPLVFWALAVPARVFSERVGILIGAAIVNLVAGAALLRSVRRLYGSTGALVAAGLIATTCWSFGRDKLAEPWTPYIALIPLMLVLVYSLELADGSLAPLPWTALAGSFVVQAHYLYLAVVLASIATGIALGVVARRRARAEADEPPPPDRRGRREVIAAALVTLGCWSFPLYDEFAHWPGNFSRWVEALQHVQGIQLQASTAWHYVVRAIGWVPLAGRGPLPALVLFDLPFAVGALATVVALVVIAVLVATIVACWRSDPRVARFAVL
ncbi:MAG TPA: glycosyltransferase family 39 protein, partial [Acidimicrobiia bacterium]